MTWSNNIRNTWKWKWTAVARTQICTSKKKIKKKTKRGNCWLYFLTVSTWCHCTVLVVNSVFLPAIVQLVFCFSLRTYSITVAALCIFPILKFQIIFIFYCLIIWRMAPLPLTQRPWQAWYTTVFGRLPGTLLEKTCLLLLLTSSKNVMFLFSMAPLPLWKHKD